MEISPINTAQSKASPAADTEKAKANISSDFETFLNMLTAQLQNQDPLDPVKSEDFAVQLATFSGVEQQVLTNDLLQSLTSQMALSGMAQFAGWVGMEARAEVAGHFDGATPLTLAPEPEASADGATLVVEDENGTVVQRMPIPVSDDPIEWSGLIDGVAVPAGNYSFSVESTENGQVTSTKPVAVYARIAEARLEGDETILVMAGGQEIPASEVTALRSPGS